MININELRLGNLFKDRLTGAILSVCDLTTDESGKRSAGFYVVDRSRFPLPDGWNAEPILLTPDVLGKIRFANSSVDSFGNRYYELRTTHSTYYFHQPGDKFYYGYWDESGFVNESINLTAVHQLQNLCFALTGEELNIQL